VHVSWNWNNGTNVSPFYWNGNNGPSNANINIGARAVILWESTEKACTTLPKGKITRKAARLVAETMRTSRSVKDEETVITWKDIEFDTMFTLEQAKIAAWRASEHKRDRPVVQLYLQNEHLLKELVDDLHRGTYKPVKVDPVQIYDRKSNKWRTHRDGFQELRKKTYLAIRRLVWRIRKRGSASLSQARSLLSRMGFVKHTDCTQFKKEVFITVAQFRLRRIVSTYEKHHAA
jgi:hypothetical protein